MKKIFMVLAAVAALVGCSKENAPMDVVAKDNFTMNASIVLDETRVTVEGEKFTDVKWVAGDEVTLSSKAGALATLTAVSGGDKDIRFTGEGEYKADTDTYYAIYPATDDPATDIVDGVASVELASQAGNDAAVLVAKAEGTKGEAIDMQFKPANALLHVAVSGVSSLSKAEFVAYNDTATATALPQSFTYDFESESVATTGEVDAYTIENPSVDGFFFSLPADLNMANGYVVRLTDASGNVCSKAYSGKMFAKATTTRVNIDFATPSVTLGAKTSYSYYLLNQPASANTCANNVIYFTGDCASTYAGIQNVYVTEVGFKVDGTTYSSANGDVTWDKSEKSFSMNNMTVSEKRGYAVEAYIVTKEHGTITSSNTLYITGLPYTLNVSANDGTWSTSGNIAWNESSSVRLGYNLSNWLASTQASMTKSDFKLPTDVNVSVDCTGKTSGTSAQKTTFTIKVSGSTIFSKTSGTSTTPASFTMSPTTCVMSTSNPIIECHNSRGTAKAASYINSLFVGYANK